MHARLKPLRILKLLAVLVLFFTTDRVRAESAHTLLSAWNPTSVQAALDPDHFKFIVESLLKIEKATDEKNPMGMKERKQTVLLQLNLLYDLLQNHASEARSLNLYSEAFNEWRTLKAAAVRLPDPKILNSLHGSVSFYLDWLRVKR